MLNLLAAFATQSNFSHCEIAIGESGGDDGQICNVLRIYNDNIGVELCQRTGRCPQYQYVQIGCSKASEQKVLRFARGAIGKPFSMMAMARSILWPRKTDHNSYFCAELCVSALQAGGLMDASVNPAAATPESVFRAFAQRGTTTGNPCVLRHIRKRNASEPNPSTAPSTALRVTEAGTKDEKKPLLHGIRGIGRSIGGMFRRSAENPAYNGTQVETSSANLTNISVAATHHQHTDTQHSRGPFYHHPHRPHHSHSHAHAQLHYNAPQYVSVPSHAHVQPIQPSPLLRRPPSQSIAEQRIREAVRKMGCAPSHGTQGHV